MYYDDQCFAYGEPGKCLILKQMHCLNCPFCKTVEELAEERAKAEKRIREIANDQERIKSASRPSD